jgi:beta-glucuronidase
LQWINGEKVVENEGGHLPFQTELSVTSLKFDQPNRITVAVNNTLRADTVPQGFLRRRTGDNYPPNYSVMEDNFDFFKYAGIHRSVLLHTTPSSYIEDITVTPEVTGTTGSLIYSVNVVGTGTVSLQLIDKQGTVVATGASASGTLQVPNAKLWWPYTMMTNASDAGYLYTLQVRFMRCYHQQQIQKSYVVSSNVLNSNVPLKVSLQGTAKDVYRLKVGIRSVKWSATSFLINDRPFYFTGFGRHEDFYVCNFHNVTNGLVRNVSVCIHTDNS